MKILIATLFSASAMACPNLSGTYPTCTGGVSNLVISQNGNEFTISQFSDGISSQEDFVADGVMTEVFDGEETYFETTTCTGNQLVIATKSADNALNVTATIWKEGNTIISQSVGVDSGESFNQTIRCQ